MKILKIGNTRRTIDFHKGEEVDEEALQEFYTDLMKIKEIVYKDEK